MTDTPRIPRPPVPAGAGDRPVIRHNDYSPLVPPSLGEWTPRLPVSVVIPAYGGRRRLDLTLAALAAQTYPSGLMEVVVVDDGSEPPLRLPGIRPENTRVVPSAPGGWGTAHALNTGVRAAEGEIVQRLDADMVTSREHIEALMRWHHLTDYVVTIGAKVFVEEPALTAAEVHAAVREGALDTLFDLSRAVPSSTEATIRRLDGLRASKNPYHVCTGPTVSFRRALFFQVGGLDPEVLRGEDTEFAYRLAMSGAVFVPDMEARAVHLGMPAQRVDREATVRVVAPFLAHRVPLRRDLRKEPGRDWLVPYVEVVLDADGSTEPEVRAAVSAALGGSLPDVAVTLVGPWGELAQGRHPVLGDPDFELRLVHEQFRYDKHVRITPAAVPDPAPIPFRYTGPVDVPLGRRSLELMIKAVTDDRAGLLVVEFPDGRTARLERTDALNRARLLTAPGENVPPGTGPLPGTDHLPRARDLTGTDHRSRVGDLTGEDLAGVIERTHGVRRGRAAEFWPQAKGRPKTVPADDGRAGAGPGTPAGGAAGGAADPTPERSPGDRPGASEPAGHTRQPARTASGPAREKLTSRLRTALRGR
ncbi:glycosyltransferase [Sphaerisporangium viridialbum]|uniref:glycosyltransferase n=1 Tax=Sphaerisporangium viridialbum TaxID=46189 RepID=UPI003C75C588